MKFEHFVLAFFILVSVTMLSMGLNIKKTQTVNNLVIEYNRNVDKACDDAMNSMIEVVDDYGYQLNLDSCRESFFHSLYASFGVMDSESGQKDLQKYVPVLVVTEVDGFYVLYHSKSYDGADVRQQWSQKFPYAYTGVVTLHGSTETAKYTVSFTMGNEIVLYDQMKGVSYSGDYRKLGTQYSSDARFSRIYAALSDSTNSSAFLRNDEAFHAFRESAMQYAITKKANYYVNKHNEIARAYGINYSFSLPVSSTDSFARTVSDVSVLAVFQGYPYGKGSKDVYSRFSVSGARLARNAVYYVSCPSFDSEHLYYHRISCKHIMEGDNWKKYDSKEQCAAAGAYPCPYCNP